MNVESNRFNVFVAALLSVCLVAIGWLNPAVTRTVRVQREFAVVVPAKGADADRDAAPGGSRFDDPNSQDKDEANPDDRDGSPDDNDDSYAI